MQKEELDPAICNLMSTRQKKEAHTRDLGPETEVSAIDKLFQVEKLHEWVMKQIYQTCVHDDQ